MLKQFITFTLLGALSFGASAASVDGVISTNEYHWTTDGIEGSDKWRTHGGIQEYNDASGGNDYDINFFGTNSSNGLFQFGAIGGEILSGRETGTGGGVGITLSDFALGFNTSSDPTVDSSGFQYAIRLMGVDDNSGIANFNLIKGGQWVGTDLYNNAYAPDHISETFRMNGGTVISSFTGAWTNNGTDTSVLEGSFDLGLLSLFELNQGGTLSTYLTMACVNDEVMVHNKVSAVPLPAAVWLLSPALVGFMSLRRRKRKA